MKQFKIITIFAALAFLVASCEDDKAEMNYVQKNHLAGKWLLSQIGTSNPISTDLTGIDYVPNQEVLPCGVDLVDNVVFGEDATYTNTDYNSDGVTCQSEAITGTYSLQDHNLTLTYVDDLGDTVSKPFLITKLTYTNLEVNYTDENGDLVWLLFTKK